MCAIRFFPLPCCRFVQGVALSEAWHVYTLHYGKYGRLGRSGAPGAPRQVGPGRFGCEKVVFVAAGNAHTVAMTAGGRTQTLHTLIRCQILVPDRA